ncbi:MAG: acylneuraminate cytidylyltransferase family protein [Candidatus Sungiibacteriota bacterium]|uniref:Acylneuraminate cytidylyltransferase family protein n=1 Tax=Candidatus Sungiibacteriota bacterium TaxID=2750080 RepID=A0A7T5URE4_9BACT|nr:MAG: acylneuraminate cytidylyltransferase family protein [Candidatus Sungbacteria bacterium]
MLVLIPARIGSKSIPKKNIVPLAGYPMLAYSILAARLAKKISRVIVSTDAEEIAEVAKKYGAEVPFIRPAEISQDHSGDREVLVHVADWLKEQEGSEPEIIVYLRPTTPLRDPADLDRAVEEFLANPETTSLRSAHESIETAYKYLKLEGKYLAGLFPDYPVRNYYDIPRHLLPQTFHPNGYVDIVKTEVMKRTNSAYGDKIQGFVTPLVGEIDSPEELMYMEYQLSRKGHPLHEELKKRYPPIL